MFELAAASYPGAFAGYKLRVIESHQSTKKVSMSHSRKAFALEPNAMKPFST